MWTAVSGASARAQAVDTIANNLANTDTLGFKKDQVAFKEYLATSEREKEGQDIPRGPIRDRDLYPLDGKDQAFVTVHGTYTSFKPGNLRVTESPLDVALEGPGFIEVGTPQGVRWTKQGSFKIGADGNLVTSQGYPVLSAQPGGLASARPADTVQPGQGGLLTQGGVAAGLNPEITARAINLRDQQGAITINESGDLYVGQQLVAKLSVGEFKDTRLLKKYGDRVFENSNPANRMTDPSTTKVHQGMLELSNVNPIEEMTNLIQAHRLFENSMKNLKAHDEMMHKEANDLGKL